MNFNYLLFFLLLSCGVKNNPLPPAGTLLPSIVDKYKKPRYQLIETKEDKEKDNNKKSPKQPQKP